MPLAMTENQKRDFKSKGFIILDPFFSPNELERLLSAVDEVGTKVRRGNGRLVRFTNA